jgi:hypothetical protein
MPDDGDSELLWVPLAALVGARGSSRTLTSTLSLPA